jgi:hypothetical protein
MWATAIAVRLVEGLAPTSTICASPEDLTCVRVAPLAVAGALLTALASSGLLLGFPVAGDPDGSVLESSVSWSSCDRPHAWESDPVAAASLSEGATFLTVVAKGFETLRSLGARGLAVVCGRLTGPLSRLPRGVAWDELSTKPEGLSLVLSTRRTSGLSPCAFKTAESVPGIAATSSLFGRLVSSGGEVGLKKLASGALYVCTLALGARSSDSFSTASSARLSLGRLYLPGEGGAGNKEPRLWKPNPPAESLLLSDEYALT